jgi:hypothetical protein
MDKSCGGKTKRMKNGGMAKVAKKEVKAHEKKMHGMKSGGVVVRGKGAATKGYKARGPMG